MKERALELLRVGLDRADAEFRDGQWECIEALLDSRRLLMVERTGWGKSMVYFLATRLLRERGTGATLLISPLLSLMRNQLEAALRIGLKAATINSSNPDEWDAIGSALLNNQIDLLLVSPERLANEEFTTRMLSEIISKVGLFVVDEAHCISDWGHDFRPDYRRITRVIEALPKNIPLLATTATANDRVVKDVEHQLGENIMTVRGPLVRKSLMLQNIILENQAERLGWLAEIIPTLPGSGIVYTLTRRDAERVADWLQFKNIAAEAYHSDIENSSESATPLREVLEQKLLNNEIKVLVATVALGMGFDKPDIGFVIHFQRPSSVVHYYQQVGRAGRAVDNAYGILLGGVEDDRIAEFFIRNAFPPQKHVTAILNALSEHPAGLSVPELQKTLNVRKGHLERALRFLTVEYPSPVSKEKTKWQANEFTAQYRINEEYVGKITDIRYAEQRQMQDYMTHRGCLMEFLARALDDPDPQPCGKCVNCCGKLLPAECSRAMFGSAQSFLRRSSQIIQPRRQWPSGNPLPIDKFSGRIKEELRASEGRALSLWRDAGWGEMVFDGKYKDKRFDDQLVMAAADLVRKSWNPNPTPEWISCVPSLREPSLMSDFAQRLADELQMPFIPCIEKILETRPQAEMFNSFNQANNLNGAFQINLDEGSYAPCLLLDDTIYSGWTMTLVAALLRRAGVVAVHPLALSINVGGD